MTKYVTLHSCLFPKRIVRKDSSVMYVGCGKCPSCLNRRASILSQRVQDECNQHLYSIFFTLTYDNENIPFYHYNDAGDNLFYPCSRRNDMPILKGEDEELAYLPPTPCNSDINGFAVCLKSDIQKFMKRLRRKIEYHHKLDNDEKETHRVRYFVSSEYGPRTFRPHYHGILWTDRQDIAECAADYIRACWSFCSKERIDVQFVSSSAPQYVAKYVNGTSNLPFILLQKSTRPFYLCSQNPSIGLYKTDFEEAEKVFCSDYLTRPRTDYKSKSVTLVPVSALYINRFWPKCYDYSNKSFADKLFVYGIAWRCWKNRGTTFVEQCRLEGILPYPITINNPNYLDHALFPEDSLPDTKRIIVKPSDLHSADYTATLACLRWCQYFNCTPYDFVQIVDIVHKKRQLYLLKTQLEYEQTYQENASFARDCTSDNFCLAQLHPLGTLDQSLLDDLPTSLPWYKFGFYKSVGYTHFDSLAVRLSSVGIDIYDFYDMEDGSLKRDVVNSFRPCNDSFAVAYAKFQEKSLLDSNKSKKLHDLDNVNYSLHKF